MKHALAKWLKAKGTFYITPGSEQIRATIDKDGLVDTMMEFGGFDLIHAGPALGSWTAIMCLRGRRTTIT